MVVDSNRSVVDDAAAVSVTTTSGGGFAWELMSLNKLNKNQLKMQNHVNKELHLYHNVSN